MWLDTLGWTATGIFSTSYFFKQPAALRKIQAGAALLWVVYGMAIHSAPVVVANLIVGVAAVYTSFRAALVQNAADTETADGREDEKDSAARKPNRMLERIARLSYVPGPDKEAPGIYILRSARLCGAAQYR
jgi:hypothetical protein